MTSTPRTAATATNANHRPESPHPSTAAYKGSPSTAERNEHLRRLRLRAIDYIHHPDFDAHNPATKERIDRALQVARLRSTGSVNPASSPGDVSGYLTHIAHAPLLNRSEESDLFWAFNCLKHRAAIVRERIDASDPEQFLLDTLEHALDQAERIRDRLIRSNLRLVVAIAKRYVDGAVSLAELISESNLALIRAVEKFDVSRGYRFSTYASWAIRNRLVRFVPFEKRQRARFLTGTAAVLDSATQRISEMAEPDDQQIPARTIVRRILAQLKGRERTVIAGRFGLSAGEPRTLEAIGQELGVSKERVRQLESRALDKLRALVERTAPQEAYELGSA